MVMKSQCSVCSNAMTINEWLCSVEDMKDEETHADQFYYQTLCLSRKSSLIFIFFVHNTFAHDSLRSQDIALVTCSCGMSPSTLARNEYTLSNVSTGIRAAPPSASVLTIVQNVLRASGRL